MHADAVGLLASEVLSIHVQHRTRTILWHCRSIPFTKQFGFEEHFLLQGRQAGMVMEADPIAGKHTDGKYEIFFNYSCLFGSLLNFLY